MTKNDAIKICRALKAGAEMWGEDDASEALDMAIEALKTQGYDEVVFDMNEFFSIVDDGKITVMRRGRGRVTVERPEMRIETTICSYGGRSEE